MDLMKTTLDALNLMMECENTVSEFYKLCSEQYSQNRTFWADLSREELAHAQVIEKLIQLIRLRPSEFAPGKSTPIDAIKTFINRVHSNIETVNKAELSEDKVLFMAYQIENTFIELQYTEVVDTQNQEYKSLLDQVMSDTHEHNKKVLKILKKMKAEAMSRK